MYPRMLQTEEVLRKGAGGGGHSRGRIDGVEGEGC